MAILGSQLLLTNNSKKLKEEMQFRPNQTKLNMVIHDGQIVKLLITQGAFEWISASPKLELLVGYGPDELKTLFSVPKIHSHPGGFQYQLK